MCPLLREAMGLLGYPKEPDAIAQYRPISPRARNRSRSVHTELILDRKSAFIGSHDRLDSISLTASEQIELLALIC